MSENEILFYATAGTVIPVLLLAYIVQLGRVVDAASLREFVEAAKEKAERDGPVNSTAWMSFRVNVWIYRRLLILALVAVPLWAEIECFRALAKGGASAIAQPVVAAGLATSGCVVLAPLLFGVIVQPIIDMRDIVSQAKKEIEQAREGAQEPK